MWSCAHRKVEETRAREKDFPKVPRTRASMWVPPASVGHSSKAQAAVSPGALLSTVMSPGPNPDWDSVGCDTGWPSWNTPSSESTPENRVSFRVSLPQACGLCRESSGTGTLSLVSLNLNGLTPLVQVFHKLVPSVSQGPCEPRQSPSFLKERRAQK